MAQTPIPHIDPFTAPGRWFRGNLHTHTTMSDGQRTPLEAAVWYREQGYDFLALTDHNHCTEVAGLSSPGFLVLPGIEVHPDRNELGEVYHVVAAGVRRSYRFTPEQRVQEAIDELRADGATVWLGHPYWVANSLQELLPIQGVIGIEVFNTTCARFGRGYSTVHWDDLLGRGRQLWGLAVDDAHFVAGDFGRGWVMVKAEALTAAALLQALEAGAFYASQGPLIHDLQVTPKEIYVRCSEAVSIDVVSIAGIAGAQAVAPDAAHPLTEHTFTRRYQRAYVRIEVKDAQGRLAWSPPVWL